MKKNDLGARLLQAATALSTNLPGKTLVLNGKPWKTGDLARFFQAQVTLMQSTTTLHTQWIQSTVSQTSGTAAARAALKALKQYIGVMYGASSELYTSGFGFGVQRSPAKPVTETRAAAVQQSRATRKARGTMGKKQRLAIKGAVQPVTAAPAAASPAAASGTSPSGANNPSRS